MKRVLRTREAAQYVGLAKSTFDKFRVYGGGPRFIQLGNRAVGYDVEDLDQWLNERKTESTSSPGPDDDV